MEVTSENFEEALPLVKEAIKECDFMSMDFELTGLFPRNMPATTIFDSIQQRYEATSMAVRTFLPIQFGLCTMRWDAENKQYAAKSFNFYIHPMIPKKGYQFCCDLASLKFLSSNHFDFNKLVAKGIPFISQQKQQQFEEQNNSTQERSDISLGPSDEEFLATSLEKIKEWLQTTDQTMQLPPCNSYLMRILYQEIPKKYPNLTISQVNVEGQRFWKAMKFERLSQQEREEFEAEMEKEKLEKMAQMAGFRRVIDLMCDAKKPLLGHNMFLDACYFYNYFLESLPAHVEEFKKALLAKFPYIIDTKTLAGETDFESSALGDLYAELVKEEEPKIELEKGESEEDKPHEAGWDAYMTAHVFLKLCKRIDKTVECPIDIANPSALSKFWNIINVTRTTSKLELTKNQNEEIVPPNVFHVYEFSEKARTSDIMGWFSQFGRVSVFWIDDTSCYVTITDDEQLEGAKLFASASHEKFKIQSLREFRNKVRQEKEEPATPPPSGKPVTPPERTRRSSLKRSGKKRPRPSSIGFSDDTEVPAKRQKTEEPFSCCIS